jgi:hypothetical protein
MCNYYKNSPGIKFEEVRKWTQREFKLDAAPDRSTIRQILKNSSRYDSIQPQNSHIHKACVITHKALEEAITTWVSQMEHQKICLVDDLFQKKAL